MMSRCALCNVNCMFGIKYRILLSVANFLRTDGSENPHQRSQRLCRYIPWYRQSDVNHRRGCFGVKVQQYYRHPWKYGSQKCREEMSSTKTSEKGENDRSIIGTLLWRVFALSMLDYVLSVWRWFSYNWIRSFSPVLTAPYAMFQCAIVSHAVISSNVPQSCSPNSVYS